MTAVRLNGAHGEGGGALFRTALGMAALTQRELSIHNIRGAMRKPGLTPEDMAFMEAILALTATEVHADLEPGDDEVVINPRKRMRGIHHTLDVGRYEKGRSLGSACVLMASLAPLMARSLGMSEVTVHGETHGAHVLAFEAVERSLIPAWREQGLYVFAGLSRAGFGPGGTGEMTFEVEPSRLTGLEWRSRGELAGLTAVVAWSEIPEHVPERASAQLASRLAKAGLEAEIELQQLPGNEPGIQVTLIGEYDQGAGSASTAGRRGQRIEQVVDQVVDDFLEFHQSDATVDPYLVDQMLLPAALAEGPSVFRVHRLTRRLQTMAWVIRQFMPMGITIRGTEGESATISVQK